MRSGRHFLQIPGPTNTPDRVLRAMHCAVIDHRGPEFAELGRGLLEDLKSVFKTRNRVVIYPASGTGAWEAALVNTLSPGDRVLMFETGQFATLWRGIAVDLGLEVDFVEGDWRHGVDPQEVESLDEAAGLVDFSVARIGALPDDAGESTEILVHEETVYKMNLDKDLIESITFLSIFIAFPM